MHNVNGTSTNTYLLELNISIRVEHLLEFTTNPQVTYLSSIHQLRRYARHISILYTGNLAIVSVIYKTPRS